MVPSSADAVKVRQLRLELTALVCALYAPLLAQFAAKNLKKCGQAPGSVRSLPPGAQAARREGVSSTIPPLFQKHFFFIIAEDCRLWYSFKRVASAPISIPKEGIK